MERREQGKRLNLPSIHLWNVFQKLLGGNAWNWNFDCICQPGNINYIAVYCILCYVMFCILCISVDIVSSCESGDVDEKKVYILSSFGVKSFGLTAC